MRPDYCQQANEPCQSMCEKQCPTIGHLKVAKLQPLSISEIAKMTEPLSHVRILSDQLISIVRAAEAAHNAKLSAPVQAVPEGWVCVPMEPTEDMLVNGQEARLTIPRGTAYEDCKEPDVVYRAMIAAAPPLPGCQPKNGDSDGQAGLSLRNEAQGAPPLPKGGVFDPAQFTEDQSCKAAQKGRETHDGGA